MTMYDDLRKVAPKLFSLDDLAHAWEEVDEAKQRQAAAHAATIAALEKVQDALVTLALQVGDNERLRTKVIQRLYWLEPEIKTTWLANAFSLKQHQIVELAGRASLPVPCSQCGTEYRVIVTSRTQMNEHLRISDTGTSFRTMCETCRSAESEKWHAKADTERTAKEARLQQLRSMPYGEYLQTPEWHDRRAQQLRRVGYRCQVCNANQTPLNIHHRTYERRGHEEFRDLVVLCSDCHSLFHSQGRLARA